jgi:mannose-6-phosphate isomerase-like protein (cupin superfamily)
VGRVSGDDASAVPSAIDLLGRAGIGPLWGMASADLNATLLAWPPGHEIAEHVNAELDVLVVVLAGQGSVVVDGVPHEVAVGSAILVPRGTRRRIAADASADGLRYLSIHRRRGPLQIQPAPER